MKTESGRDISASMLIKALDTTTKKWKQTKCSSTDEWKKRKPINNVHSIYVDCNAVWLKKILSFATK